MRCRREAPLPALRLQHSTDIPGPGCSGILERRGCRATGLHPGASRRGTAYVFCTSPVADPPPSRPHQIHSDSKKGTREDSLCQL